jgi:predicted ATPase
MLNCFDKWSIVSRTERVGDLIWRDWQGASATEIEACFARAIAITRTQGARSLELRATRDLARLWRDQGRHRDAYALLAPAFGWFKESFETADLRTTKALLDELT